MAENGNGSKPAKKKRNLSPETRQRLSEAAKKRHAEGKLGGAEFGRMGGRPRKDRAAASVAEKARDKAKDIAQVFEDAIDPSQPINVRVKAAQAWLEIEREEGKLSLQEGEADHRDKSREELLEIVRSKMKDGAAATIIRNQLESESGIVDAEVVD
jgi:hypothetical protein